RGDHRSIVTNAAHDHGAVRVIALLQRADKVEFTNCRNGLGPGRRCHANEMVGRSGTSSLNGCERSDPRAATSPGALSVFALAAESAVFRIGSWSRSAGGGPLSSHRPWCRQTRVGCL